MSIEHAALLAKHRDLLFERPLLSERALEARGWAAPLADLDAPELARLEEGGLLVPWPAALPNDLHELVAEARALTTFPELERQALRPLRRRESPRKLRQIAALAHEVEQLAGDCDRVVDVGAGHGHLARELASTLGRPVVAIDRDPRLLAEAARLGGPRELSLRQLDVRPGSLELGRRDCVVALHACGELSDAIVREVGAAGARLALVGCCLQKRASPTREPLAPLGPALDLAVPRAVLGVSNVVAGAEGVESTRRENLEARLSRVVLLELLRDRDPSAPLGSELRGLNRRAAHLPLEELVERAFAARGWSPPTAQRCAEVLARSRVRFDRARRLSLPRAVLGRVLEAFVATDRARHLERVGFEVRVVVAFPPQVSARNLLLLAKPARGG
jgi:SAM-dependent methyltransferase